LDTQRLGRTNFVVAKAKLDTEIRKRVADKKRVDFTQSDLDLANSLLQEIGNEVERELFDAQT